MDLAAKVYWEEAIEQHLTPQVELSGEPWSIWMNGKKLVKNRRGTIYEVHTESHLEYHVNVHQHARSRPPIASSRKARQRCVAKLRKLVGIWCSRCCMVVPRKWRATEGYNLPPSVE